MKRNDNDRLREALTHIDALHRHLERQDLPDETVADAVSLRLASAIETLRTTTGELETRLFGDDWARIWATRNHIAHGYAFVSQDLIRETIKFNLPDFERTLRAALDKLG
ncbi:DUF86 domain-containing protein [Corynebacterium nuruki]|uniref:HepT-like ribonuclease domain-containing protein n=1 Tax=Corynebacterium nuruki TaxID=1032851 RepID=UPI0039BF892C